WSGRALCGPWLQRGPGGRAGGGVVEAMVKVWKLKRFNLSFASAITILQRAINSVERADWPAWCNNGWIIAQGGSHRWRDRAGRRLPRRISSVQGIYRPWRQAPFVILQYRAHRPPDS